jgi:hypothetical protein
MKKLVPAIVVLLFFSATLLIAQEKTPEAATIREAYGTVELRAPGSDAWVPAKAGDALSPETVISTGFRSMAVIGLGASTLTVRPLTRLSLEELGQSQGLERIRLHLRTGRVKAEVHSPLGGKAEFEVISPMVTASVRGTVFEFDTLNLEVNEGTVQFTGADNSVVLVDAGGTSQADPQTGRPADPTTAGRADLSPALPVGAGDTGAPFVSEGSAAVPPAPPPVLPVKIGWE